MITVLPYRTNCMYNVLRIQVISSGNSNISPCNFSNPDSLRKKLLLPGRFIDSQICATGTYWIWICCIYNGIRFYLCYVITDNLKWHRGTSLSVYAYLLLLLSYSHPIFFNIVDASVHGTPIPRVRHRIYIRITVLIR